jgi:DNA-binding CsgD family transcriptional regulator
MKKLIQEYKQTFNRKLKLTSENYRLFMHFKMHLLELSFFDSNPMALYDLFKDSLRFCYWPSKEYCPFGMDSLSMLSYKEMIHPHDLQFVLETEIAAYSFLKTVSRYDLIHYKLLYECRIKDNTGNYRRYLHHFTVVSFDNNGAIWMVLLKLYRIMGEKTNPILHTPTLLNIESRTIIPLFKHPFFSKREIEVLELMVQGLSSKEMSEKLFISDETVRNHRKNILFKTQTDTAIEAILYAKNIGFL